MKKEEIKNHIIANRRIDSIRKRTVEFVRGNIGQISEHDVSGFIVSEIEKEGMSTAKPDPIHFLVANEHTDDSHWSFSTFKPKIIGKDSLLMMDVWARLKSGHSPFMDITWMFYVGKEIPKQIQEAFDKVTAARDAAVFFIRKELKNNRLPEAGRVDELVRDYFRKSRLDQFFTHGTGHSIGYTSPHGKNFKLTKGGAKKIEPNILFTIEPGLYFKGRFGIRSEIDCYITNDYKLIITSSVQKEITII